MYPNAVASLRRDQEKLSRFSTFRRALEAIRTANPIESSCDSPAPAAMDGAKGQGSRKRGPTLVYKLPPTAEERWRRLNGAEFLAPGSKLWRHKEVSGGPVPPLLRCQIGSDTPPSPTPTKPKGRHRQGLR